MFLEDVDRNHPAEFLLVDSAWRSLRWLKLWVMCVWLTSLCRLYYPLHDEGMFDSWAVLNLVGTLALFTPIAACDRHITRLFKIEKRFNGLHFLPPFVFLCGVQSVLDFMTHIPFFLDSDVLSIQLFAASVVVQLIAAVCAQSAYARQKAAIAGPPSDIESGGIEGAIMQQVELVGIISAHIMMAALPPLPPGTLSPRQPVVLDLW
eukprot:GEMP01028729.1.p1 GENE.GEMP01028729.1~~GEMP01028729.1.p1  ORF type:complete len:206 (+),score=58.63 GEMP01028729.1:110-727(+)